MAGRNKKTPPRKAGCRSVQFVITSTDPPLGGLEVHYGDTASTINNHLYIIEGDLSSSTSLMRVKPRSALYVIRWGEV